MTFVTTPLVLEITAGAFGHLASTSSTTRGRPDVISSSEATPPEWKVRSVN